MMPLCRKEFNCCKQNVPMGFLASLFCIWDEGDSSYRVAQRSTCDCTGCAELKDSLRPSFALFAEVCHAKGSNRTVQSADRLSGFWVLSEHAVELSWSHCHISRPLLLLVRCLHKRTLSPSLREANAAAPGLCGFCKANILN